MSPLRTAPCTRCGARIVFGQRRCGGCGTAFDYGASGPPEPTQAQVDEALAAFQMQQAVAAQGPAGLMQGGASTTARPAAVPGVPGVPGGGPGAAGARPAATVARPVARPMARPAPTPSREGPAVMDLSDLLQPDDDVGHPPPQARAPAFPMSLPDGAPVVDDNGADFLDRGRYDDVASAPVATEEIPGFVDSRLFGAFTPKDVATEAVEGLEQTAFEDDGGARVVPEYVPVERTAQDEVGAVQTEAIPGFVDSTLFKAFTPATVDTEAVDGLELGASARVARKPAKKAKHDDDAGRRCAECGTPHERASCPSCGSRRVIGAEG